METREVNFGYIDKFSAAARIFAKPNRCSRNFYDDEDYLRRTGSPSRFRSSRPSTPSNQDTDHSSYSSDIRKGPYCHEVGQCLDGSSVLLRTMSSLFMDQELSDISITVGQKLFHAHKLLLCLSSDVFKVMLTNPQWPESQKGHIVLREEPECIHVFPKFLKFFYTGIIQLNHTEVLPLLMLADKYNVVELRMICVDYMCSHVVTITRQNRAVSWYQYAKLCGHDALVTTCEDFICYNFHKVMSTEDFLLMERCHLLEILKRSDVVIPDEYTLYRGIIRWLDSQEMKVSSTEEFQEIVYDVMSCIRFRMMLPSQLKELDHEPLNAAFACYFKSKISDAYEYQMSPQDVPMNGYQTSSMSCQVAQSHPRNYINDTWGTAFVIDNFSSLPLHEVRPLFFSSPVSGSKADENRCLEWNVDLFPKGVMFQKCTLIGLWRNLEVSGTMYNTVRLTLEAKPPELRRVDVSVLIFGVQDNVEYVKRVIHKRCIFDKTHNLHKIDDLVPYEELNAIYSPYLTGADGNSFKIIIVIKPV